MKSQSKSFQRYGVWADWDTPYLTLQHEYEAAQIEVFGRMFLNGHIYRGFKPVHWSPSSRTALAEAELEYPEGHTSKSIYVSFPVTTLPPCLKEESSHTPVSLICWTTTPWTIPSNRAIAVNPHLSYSLVESSEIGRLVVATDLIDSLSEKVGGPLRLIKSFRGEDLSGCHYLHPLSGDSCPVVQGGEYITADTGTGLVHTAPGHGQEDYKTGLKYDLKIFSPVDDAGCFTHEAGESLKGKNVLGDGNKAVIEMLRESGHLLSEMNYKHK